MATRHTTVDTLVVGTVFVALATHTGGWGAVNLANVNAVTGTLPVGNGGTGQASFAAGVIHSTGAALASSLVVNADITVGTINLDKLAQSGAASGQVATWSGTAWVPSPASGGTITGVTAGAGLTGGGVSGVVTIDVVAADGTIVVNANSIQVGVVPVAQLSAGSNGQILTVVTGVPTWVSASGSVTLAGDVTGPSSSNTITNLAVSKLAPGAANTVLWSNGSVNSFTGSPILSTSLAIGTNPASAGAIRLGNNQAINSRNAANSSDFNLVSLNASNIVVVGAEFASGIQAPWFDSFGVIHTDDAGHLSVSLIVATDITNATITTSKIAPGTSGQVFVTNATPAAQWVTPAGDWLGPLTANTVRNLSGDGTTVTVSCPNVQFNANVSSPRLLQAQSTTGAGQTLGIVAQSSLSSGNVNGGSLVLQTGVGNGTGVPGSILLRIGGITAFATLNAVGLRIGDSAAPTHMLEVAGNIFVEGPSIQFKASVIGPQIGQQQATSGNGVDTIIFAQGGFSSGNNDGGILALTGGISNGTGKPGGVKLMLGSSDALVQVVSLVASGGVSTTGVVSLCRKTAVTTTQTTSIVDGAVYLGDANQTLGSVDRSAEGCLFYSKQGCFTFRSGTTAGPVGVNDSSEIQFVGNVVNGASSGGSGATPANTAGFLVVYIDGIQRKIPFYPT